MPDNLLSLLNLCLLALLYLFFVRVLWSVWAEVRGPRAGRAAPGATAAAAVPSRSRRKDSRPATRVTIVEPADLAGRTYDLAQDLTVGRAPDCDLGLPDDTYLSQRHARIGVRDGEAYVEDLASTNGTYLNGARVTSPSPLRRGDRVQVGTTVLEAG